MRRCVIPTSGSAPGGGEHLVEVQHRLAHPHEDAVVDRLDPAEVERLVEDLRRGQVPAELHLPGRAERAGERAAGLGRDADRPAAVAVAHQHRLDRLAVGGVEERLHRAVLRLAPRGRPRASRTAPSLGELRRAEPAGHVRHRVVARGAARPPSPRPGGRGRRARRARRGTTSGGRDPRVHGSAGDSPRACPRAMAG